YKWAEVLSADAYEAFEEAAAGASGEHGTLDPATGARFRKEILAVGGARPAAESFQAFRGRAPRIDARLRHSGMAGGRPPRRRARPARAGALESCRCRSVYRAAAARTRHRHARYS